MSRSNERPERRSPRLAGFDYRRAGWYFVTVCTKDGALIFGDVADGEMHLNELGRIAETEWLRTAHLRPYLVRDAFVVMPNHVHLLFGLVDDLAAANGGDINPNRRDMARHVPTSDAVRRFANPTARSVSSIIGAYKSAVTREVNRHWGASGTIWQGRFHDRVVRSEAEHQRIRQYILDNPLRWHLDPYKP